MKNENEVCLVKVNDKSFAYGFNYYKIFWLFIIGCLFGFFYEVALEYIKTGNIVGRAGVMYGPLNPVYGFAMAIVAILFGKTTDYKRVFLYSALFGGTFEYIASYVQEKIFGTISWDYSKHFLNIDGRTTIPFALFWGLLAVLILKFAIPFLSKFIEKIPNKIGIVLTWVLTIFMIYNMTISTIASKRNLERYKNVPANSKLDTFLDRHFPNEKMRDVYQNYKFVE